MKGDSEMIFVGDDWSEEHHDIEIQDEAGMRLRRKRLPEGIAGIVELHAMVAGYASDPAEVVVGIETDRGLWVAALVAAGYQVYAVNPKAVARYRERYGGGSGAKSDAADAKVLADLVRTDRHNHRPVAGDSEAGQGIKVLARAHQRLVWSCQRQVNSLRSLLREYYPAALAAFDDLDHRDALAVLSGAPTPAAGRRLSRAAIATTLRRGGRQRSIDDRAAEIDTALRAPQPEPPTTLADAYGAAVAATVAVITEMTRQLATLEAELERAFGAHTLTPRSSAAFPDWAPSSAPECSASSVTTRTDTPTIEPARTTPAHRRSPLPPANAEWSRPATSATATSPTPATCGPSAPSPTPPGPAATTTNSGPKALNTTVHYGPSPTDWSASCTTASPSE